MNVAAGLGRGGDMVVLASGWPRRPPVSIGSSSRSSRAAIPEEPGALMLKQLAEWRQTESDCRASELAEERTRLGKAESRLSRLLDVYLEGDVEQADYSRKKGELLHEKAGIRERIRRIEREGSVWLEPLEAFLNDAILAETTAFSVTEAELRVFHRRIGSNLSLIEPNRTIRRRRKSRSRGRRHGGQTGRSRSCKSSSRSHGPSSQKPPPLTRRAAIPPEITPMA
jgi:hypothetical protein